MKWFWRVSIAKSEKIEKLLDFYSWFSDSSHEYMSLIKNIIFHVWLIAIFGYIFFRMIVIIFTSSYGWLSLCLH
jgi:hypothetical protein